MRGDGDGWVVGENGTRHWGRHGAAGLLLRAPAADGTPTVLLQHRALWSHQGGTWALPGGARDSHETTVHAAVREAEEEAAIAADFVHVRGEKVTARADSGWTYTTVVADSPGQLETTPNGESTELRWVPEDMVDQLPLHPGFEIAWPTLRTTPLRILLDTANVLGSRPNGWWRDRSGATGELLTSLADAVPRTVELPDGDFGWLTHIDAVLEGEARNAAFDDARVPVIHAPGSGDDELARRAETADSLTALVTADRGLRQRVPTTVHVLAPSTVLAWLGSAS
ncbi:NUDIX domain-containing protein [Rhodococcus sp. B10]|uniref:NUDIX domain-containing protein n=1 Tax=Rhodococcus sp. B10 TaxID=2695876 RepID=UPI0014310714|nr:NUDIX domain-containing protein [Rhodococcus sp. B10]NIL78908.1 putative Nudix hydrolase NudL [Rhodococcus sp. B10]